MARSSTLKKSQRVRQRMVASSPNPRSEELHFEQRKSQLDGSKWHHYMPPLYKSINFMEVSKVWHFLKPEVTSGTLWRIQAQCVHMEFTWNHRPFQTASERAITSVHVWSDEKGHYLAEDAAHCHFQVTQFLILPCNRCWGEWSNKLWPLTEEKLTCLWSCALPILHVGLNG